MSFLFENQFVSAFKTMISKMAWISEVNVGEILFRDFKKLNPINRKFVGISKKYAGFVENVAQK